MKKIWRTLGIIAYWIAWPGLWLVLRRSHRTRALIICNGEFLVLRGWLGDGKWGLPGGGLHRHEDIMTGLLREVKEETGIDLSPHQTKHAFDGYVSDRGLGFNYHAFIAELPEKPTLIKQPLEVAALDWQPLSKPTLSLSPDAQAVLDWWRNKL